MSERFFITTQPAGDRAVLEGDEARHLTRVLRAKVGDTVSLFDGRGREWPALAGLIARMADRPSETDVWKILRANRSEILAKSPRHTG